MVHLVDAELTSSAEPSVYVGEDSSKREHDGGDRPDRQRANQNIPPAMRRELMVQFGGCCALPGCHNRAFLDLHHLYYPPPGQRPESGSIVVLCGAHHDAAHAGRLIIDRDEHGKLQFFHADGRRYGSLTAPAPAPGAAPPSTASPPTGPPTTADEQAARRIRDTAEEALCSLGFRRAQVRSAVASCGLDTHVGAGPEGDDAEVLERVIRQALAVLTAKGMGGSLPQ